MGGEIWVFGFVEGWMGHGEVHLERCLHDLRTTFAPGIELVVSPPIVPLRESVAPDACGRAGSIMITKVP